MQKRLIKLDDSFPIFYCPVFIKFRPLQTSLFVWYVSVGDVRSTLLHISMLWSSLRKSSQKLECVAQQWRSPAYFALLPIDLSKLDVTTFRRTMVHIHGWMKTNIYSSMFTPSDLDRWVFSFDRWYDANCVHVRFSAMGDNHANCATSSTLCSFEHPKAMDFMHA